MTAPLYLFNDYIYALNLSFLYGPHHMSFCYLSSNLLPLNGDLYNAILILHSGNNQNDFPIELITLLHIMVIFFWRVVLGGLSIENRRIVSLYTCLACDCYFLSLSRQLTRKLRFIKCKVSNVQPSFVDNMSNAIIYNVL